MACQTNQLGVHAVIGARRVSFARIGASRQIVISPRFISHRESMGHGNSIAISSYVLRHLVPANNTCLSRSDPTHS